MHEDQVLRMALACIRWNQFGECRTDGWPGLPPTAADTVAALEASLAKPQPVGGALTDEVIDATITAHGTGGWQTPADMRKFARAIEAATLSAPVAQPGEAVSEPTVTDDDEIWGLIKGIPFDWTGDSDTLIRYARAILALATPIAAQPAAAEPDMRHILLVQIHNLIDLAERYSRLMHKRGDADERDRIDGEIAHVRKTVAPYNYNGPTIAAPAQAAAVPDEFCECPNCANGMGLCHKLEAAAVPEAVERDALREVLKQLLLEFGLQETFGIRLARSALSQGDVSGEGEGA